MTLLETASKIQNSIKRLLIRSYPMSAEPDCIRIAVYPKAYSMMDLNHQKIVCNQLAQLIESCVKVRYVQQTNPLRYFIEVPKGKENVAIGYLKGMNPEVVDLAPTANRYIEDIDNDCVIELDKQSNKKFHRVLLISNLSIINFYEKFYDNKIEDIEIHYIINRMKQSEIDRRLSMKSKLRLPLPAFLTSAIMVQNQEIEKMEIQADSLQIAKGDRACDFDMRVKISASSYEELNQKHIDLVEHLEPSQAELESCFINQLGAYCSLDPRNSTAVTKYDTPIDVFLSELKYVMPFRYHISSSTSGLLVGESDNEEFYWDDDAVDVPHIFVTGSSGSGKSEFAKNLLRNYWKMGYNILIIDGAQKKDKITNLLVWDFDEIVDECIGIQHFKFNSSKLNDEANQAVIDKQIYSEIYNFKDKFMRNRSGGKAVIVLDECHMYRNCPLVLGLMDLITRTGRKEQFQLLALTQLVSDLEGTPAKSLMSICQRKVYLYQAEEEMPYLVEKRYITAQQSEYLSRCQVGEALLKIDKYKGKDQLVKRVKFYEKF